MDRAHAAAGVCRPTFCWQNGDDLPPQHHEREAGAPKELKDGKACHDKLASGAHDSHTCMARSNEGWQATSGGVAKTTGGMHDAHLVLGKHAARQRAGWQKLV